MVNVESGVCGPGGGGSPGLKGGTPPGPLAAVADTGLHVLQNVQGHVCTSGQKGPKSEKSCTGGVSGELWL